MKTLWSIISILAVAHLLALAGFIGFLAGTERLSRDRLEAARDLFLPTLAEEQAAFEEAAKAQDEAGGAGAGAEGGEPTSAATGAEQHSPGGGAEQRARRFKTVDELLREREMRFEEDRKHLARTLADEYAKLEREWEELRAQRESFQQEIERQRALREDEQFRKMVEILKGLSGEELKAKFDAFLAAGDTALVVDILDAFDKRTAQKVMKEYETEEENALAADLLVRLKDRGLTPGDP